MITRTQGPGLVQTAIGSAWVFTSLALVVAGITLLFLGMRSVMDVGGACADGGPYVSAQPCPEGVPLAMMGGIWGGIVALGIYAWQTFKRGIPGFLALAWPALFISLGWNFLEYGLDAPGPATLEWGWLICAIVFMLMGGGPLLLFIREITKSLLPWGHPPALPESATRQAFRSVLPGIQFATATSGPIVRRGQPRVTIVREEPPPRDTSPVSDDDSVVVALERLAALRASGALTEAEFALAKERVLRGEAS